MGTTPIYLAARDGKTEMVKILAPLCRYSDPNKEKEIYIPEEFVSIVPRDEIGITPIVEAIRKGYVEIVRLLAPLAIYQGNIIAGFSEAVQGGQTECVHT